MASASTTSDRIPTNHDAPPLEDSVVQRRTEAIDVTRRMNLLIVQILVAPDRCPDISSKSRTPAG
jgi:hypothetical protein